MNSVYEIREAQRVLNRLAVNANVPDADRNAAAQAARGLCAAHSDLTRDHIVTAQNAMEHRPHEFGAEASELGLAPGLWPTELPTSLGNGQPFRQVRALRTSDGEFSGVVYKQDLGCVELTVFND